MHWFLVLLVKQLKREQNICTKEMKSFNQGYLNTYDLYICFYVTAAAATTRDNSGKSVKNRGTYWCIYWDASYVQW